MLPLAQSAISTSLSNGLTTIVEFLPKLVGFLIILLIGYIVAKVVKGILTKVLQKRGPRQGPALRARPASTSSRSRPARARPG